MSQNPLKPKSDISVSVEEEQKIKSELITNSEMSILDLSERKAMVDKAREFLDLDTKERNIIGTAKLNEHFVEIIDLIADPQMLGRVQSTITNAKDLNEFVKAISELNDLRMDLLRNAEDINATNPTQMKIELAFGSGVDFGFKGDDK